MKKWCIHAFKIFILALGLSLFTSGADVFAINNSPEQSDIWHTVSSGQTNGRGNNLLYAPMLNLVVVSDRNGGFDVTFNGGGQCNDLKGFDSGVNGPRVTVFRVRATDARGAATATSAEVNNGGVCDQGGGSNAVKLRIPANSSNKLTLTEHKGRYMFRIAVYINGATPTENGMLNVFKAQVPSSSGARADIGAAKSASADHPVALLGRPSSSSIVKDYYLKFGTPCDVAANSEVTFRWFDADNGTVYQPSRLGMYFQLVDKTDGANTILQTTTGKTQIRGSDLGGEAEGGTVRYRLQPGKQYEWQWRNVTNRNGVQVHYPFDSVGYIGNCETEQRDAYDGECFVTKINNLSTVDSRGNSQVIYLTPGSEFTAEFVVFNGGTSSWDLRYDTGKNDSSQGNDSVVLGSEGDTRRWGPNRISMWGEGNALGGAALTTDSNVRFFADADRDGGTVNRINFKVPEDAASGEDMSFGWRLFKVANTTKAIPRIGKGCGADIKIKSNRPFLRVSGGDVRAGADLVTQASLCPTDMSRRSLSARIDANGIWEPTSGDDSNALAFLNGTSSGQYGVFASGNIGTLLGSSRFPGNNARERESRKDLTFANLPSDDETDYGNFYGGGAVDCIEFNEQIAGATVIDPDRVNAWDQIKMSNDSIYKVEGDLTINSDYDDQSNKTVIVEGNIYIEGNVGVLRGTFIALPNSSSPEKGLIDTCSNYKRGDYPDSGNAEGLSIARCNRQLTVFGRVIAREIVWKRTFGTIGGGEGVFDQSPGCVFASAGLGVSTFVPRLESCAAERIILTPDVYFDPNVITNESSSAGGNVPIDSIELPPIY